MRHVTLRALTAVLPVLIAVSAPQLTQAATGERPNDAACAALLAGLKPATHSVDQFRDCVSQFRRELGLVREELNARGEDRQARAALTQRQLELLADINALFKTLEAKTLSKEGAEEASLTLESKLSALRSTLEPPSSACALAQTIAGLRHRLETWPHYSASQRSALEELEESARKTCHVSPTDLTLPLPGRALLATHSLARVNLREYLLDAYTAYRNLSRRQPKSEGDPTSEGVETAREFKELKTDLYDLLTINGLRPRLVGVLVPAVGFSRLSEDGQSESEGQQALVVRFGSRYVPVRNSPFNASLLGKVGFVPVFSMVEPEPLTLSTETVQQTTTTLADGTSTTTTQTSLQKEETCQFDATGKPLGCTQPGTTFLPKLQTGLVWDIGGRLGYKPGEVAELAIVGRVGQTQFSSDFSLIEKGPSGEPVVVGPVSGTGDAAFYFETGLRASIFQDNRAHSQELGFLTPLFEAEFGWRWDRRFRNKAALESFNAPSDRYYLRVSISGLPVYPGKGDVFYLSFGVDHEWARQRGGLPSVTRVFLQGNLDLPSLFGRGKKNG